MNLKQASRRCPCCCNEFLPKRSDQVYLDKKHKDIFNNRKKKKENEEKYAAEKKLRLNVKILEKILTHHFYKSNKKIERRILEFAGFDFNVFTEITEHESGTIFWSHQLGVQVAGVEQFGKSIVEYITIHQK